MIKTPVKFQKDRSKIVGRVVLTSYLLQTRNHALRITHHAPRKAEYHVPSLFFEKAGDNKKMSLNIFFLSCRMNFVGTQKRVRISNGKRDVGVRAIELRLYITLAMFSATVPRAAYKDARSFATFMSWFHHSADAHQQNQATRT